MGDIDAELIVADRWALYRGPLLERGLHHHSTAAVCAVDVGVLTVELADGTGVSGAAVSIAAGVRHRLVADPSARLAILVFEPRRARRREATRVAVATDASTLARRLAEASAADVDDLLEEVEGAEGVPASSRAQDPRVAAAMELVREEPSRALAAHELAARVHLSPSRLSALFAAETGMSLRRYRLWVRLTAAARAVAAGAGLADAAAASGFADAAHLSATARRVLGISPTQVLGRGVRVTAVSSVRPEGQGFSGTQPSSRVSSL